MNAGAQPADPRTESAGSKSERVYLRLSAEEKDVITSAASFMAQDVTSFIMGHVLPAARSVIHERDTIAATTADLEIIADLLENPPQPNEALLAAARKWSEL